MARYVALLRGVNVGGNNKLPMKDLPAIFQKCGCSNVRTYIQSGNVVFDCPRSIAKLHDSIGSGIEKKFGFKPLMVFRTLSDLKDVVKNNPFLKAGAPETELHVVFLEKAPAAEELTRLEEKRVPPEEFAARGKDVYLRLPNGAGNSKMAGVKMKTLATARNWRTVNKLIEMMETE
jgi:uncharacterized protein (DUF1697 family)